MKLKLYYLIACMVMGASSGLTHKSEAAGRLNQIYTVNDMEVLRGKVINEEGDPLPGVTVMIKGTNIGVVTDGLGNYSLHVDTGQVLAYSFIGYNSQEVVYTGQDLINITLSISSTQLAEVVTVGYGVQAKESVVGSISQTGGDDIQKQNVPEVANALAGLLPGLETIQSTSLPGGYGERDNATRIYIRGRTTWNGAQPLILIDGVERSINDVDGYEIERISILKDASATAVFGVRGANGVILITTKRGKEGKTRFNFDIQNTVNTLSRQPRVMNSYDGNLQKNRAILNEIGADPSSWANFQPMEVLQYYRTQEYPELYPDVDWMDEFTKDYAMSQQANLSINGGSKFVKYFGSLSYLHQGGIVDTRDYGQGYNPAYKYDRFNFRSNLDFRVTKTTKVSVNLSGMYGVQKGPGGNNTVFATFWKSLYGHPPDVYPVRYADGMWSENLAADKYLNGITAVNFNGVSRSNRTQINTDLKLEQQLNFITGGLSVRARISFDNFIPTVGPNIQDDGITTKYIPPSVLNFPEEERDLYTIYNYPNIGGQNGYNFTPFPITYTNESSITSGLKRATNYEGGIDYAQTFDKHDVTGLLLVQRIETASNQGFMSFREDWVSRFTYGYNSKYLLELNGAYSGSEKFDRKYRFGFFPSMAIGWVLSNEEFFKKSLPAFDLFKIRYSNGLVGNDQGIARWQYVSNWNALTRTWRFGSPFLVSTGMPSTIEGDIANPNIHWETAHKQNIGMDAEIFKSKLTVAFDYFWEKKNDIFVSADARTSNDIFGAPLPAANLGKTKTHGWELDLNYRLRITKDLSLITRYSRSQVQNKIINRDDPLLRPAHQKQAGFAIGQVRSQLNQPGIIQSWDELYTGVMGEDNNQRLPGDFRQIDYNADGVIDGDDNVPVGHSKYPMNMHSLLLNLRYKGFDARILFYGVWNVNTKTNYIEFNEGYTLLWDFQVKSAWNPANGITDDATYRGLRYNTSSPKGDWDVEDGSYTRIKSAEIGYTFSPKVIKRAKLSNLRIFLRGYNLAFWSKMREDREWQEGGLAMRTMSYPLTKNFTVGIAIGF